MKQALFVFRVAAFGGKLCPELGARPGRHRCDCFLLISSVRQQQTHEAIRAQMTAKQTALNQANGSWIYVANHPNETNPVSVAQAKQKVQHAKN